MIFSGDIEEWGGAKQKYETLKEELGNEISLCMGFWKFGGGLIEFDEVRQKM